MLPVRPVEAPLPSIEKSVDGRDCSQRGAFCVGDTLTLCVRVPRALGATGVVLRIAPDGGADQDLALTLSAQDKDEKVYRLVLPLSSLCEDETGGLFYYEYLFLRGADTLFTDTRDNLTFGLSSTPSGRFRLLVCEQGFAAPAWFAGRTMYHAFVDRFAKGAGKRRADAVYHERWDEEIEQFGAYPGAPVPNNEFFGGTLWGIIDKLDYLASLGVGVLYLSPIFRAASNHKYDTGDYEQVDEQFGGDEALVALLEACKKRDIGVVLDGVFNHTGSDSKYFNKEGKYPQTGAFQSKKSPYHDWFCFKEFPHSYESWWGVEILPKLRLSNPDTHAYFVGEGGIVEKYTKMGVAGWRLDVADELPDAFLDDLRTRVKSLTGGQGIVIGEVWENAADKISYGRRRRYFRGRQLDSVMNYPLRRGLISFVRDRNAEELASVLRELWSSYPESVCHSLMNILSTHDTERILTVLGGAPDDGTRSNAELRDARLSCAERESAVKRLQMASALQFTVFGVPSLFYGDEAGQEGYHDPFCRRPFPWGKEDETLQNHYRLLGKMRKEHSCLGRGDFSILSVCPHAIVFERRDEHSRLIVAANRGSTPLALPLPCECRELLSGARADGVVRVMPDQVQIWSVL